MSVAHSDQIEQLDRMQQQLDQLDQLDLSHQLVTNRMQQQIVALQEQLDEIKQQIADLSAPAAVSAPKKNKPVPPWITVVEIDVPNSSFGKFIHHLSKGTGKQDWTEKFKVRFDIPKRGDMANIKMSGNVSKGADFPKCMLAIADFMEMEVKEV